MLSVADCSRTFANFANMKLRLFFAMMLALIASTEIFAQEAPQQLFPYPAIPDSITDFRQRSNFYVHHFWDRADMKKIFSSRPAVAQAFADFIAPMTIADRDTVLKAMDKFMHSLDKAPDNQLFIVGEAEKQMYGPEATVPSDELYLATIRPYLENKKAKSPLKARYDAHVKQLEHSLVGRPLGELKFTDRAGHSLRFLPRTGQAVILYLNDPDCDDCNLTRVRLKADPRANELIESGELMVLSLSPCDPSEEWKSKVANYPETWLVGATPELDMMIDLRHDVPNFYIVDQDGTLVAKNLNIDQILEILSRI